MILKCSGGRKKFRILIKTTRTPDQGKLLKGKELISQIEPFYAVEGKNGRLYGNFHRAK